MIRLMTNKSHQIKKQVKVMKVADRFGFAVPRLTLPIMLLYAMRSCILWVLHVPPDSYTG